MDAEIKALIQVLIEGQIHTDKSVGNLADAVSSHVHVTDARAVRMDEQHARTEQTILSLAITVDKYVSAADARMKRIEENLDGLIRAITKEHTNGKAH